jgi:hypothetical protein
MEIRLSRHHQDNVSNIVVRYARSWLWETEVLQEKERATSLLPLSARTELTWRTVPPVPVLAVPKWNTEQGVRLEPSRSNSLLAVYHESKFFPSPYSRSGCMKSPLSPRALRHSARDSGNTEQSPSHPRELNNIQGLIHECLIFLVICVLWSVNESEPVSFNNWHQEWVKVVSIRLRLCDKWTLKSVW